MVSYPPLGASQMGELSSQVPRKWVSYNPRVPRKWVSYNPMVPREMVKQRGHMTYYCWILSGATWRWVVVLAEMPVLPLITLTASPQGCSYFSNQLYSQLISSISYQHVSIFYWLIY